jgi:hypothetical protein
LLSSDRNYRGRENQKTRPQETHLKSVNELAIRVAEGFREEGGHLISFHPERSFPDEN